MLPNGRTSQPFENLSCFLLLSRHCVTHHSTALRESSHHSNKIHRLASHSFYTLHKTLNSCNFSYILIHLSRMQQLLHSTLDSDTWKHWNVASFWQDLTTNAQHVSVMRGQAQVDRGEGLTPCGCTQRKLEPTDIILSSSPAKKLAFLYRL